MENNADNVKIDTNEICGCGQPIIADHWQAQCDECYQNFNRSSKSIKDQLDEMDRARPRWVD